MTAQTRVVTIPLLPKDQYRPLDNLRSQLYFIVRDKLNGEILRNALEELIRDHVQILGARLKPTGPQDALEYQLPRPFPNDYALFGWSSSSNSTSFSEVHILDDDREKGTTAITWGTPTEQLEKLWMPAEWPLERKHEKPGCPLFLVHLTHYTDTTVVSTSLPHAVADQMGYASVIKAWLAVAQGKVPIPFLQPGHDIFDTASKFPQETLQRKGQYRVKSLWDRVGVIFSHAVEVIWAQQEDRRLLFLLESSVTRLKKSYNRQVQEKYGLESPQLSTNDVITGILTKLRYLDIQKPTYLSLSGTINARGRHPALPPGQPFLHNALGYSSARFQIMPDTTAAEIAYQNRLAVNEAVKLESIERCFAVHAGVWQGGYSPHIGEPGDTTFSVTNWTSAWKNIDFSVASVKHSMDLADTGSAPQIAQIVAATAPSVIVLGLSMERSVSVLRFSTQILCRAEGGYWCNFACSKMNMDAIDHLVERNGGLDDI